jgi:osmotically inducible protein OsmC
MKRNATAVWNGTGKEGSGHLTTQSTAINNTQYSWGSRFAEGVGTNPEELIAAAHAGCFTMKVSFLLNAEGFTADELTTRCDITLDTAQGAITKSELKLTGKVPNIDAAKFAELANKAKEECIISKVLNCETTLEASLG